MSKEPEEAFPLGETARDRDVALARGALGLIPVVGSVIGELVTMTIPNQRAERLETYARHLGERLQALEPDALRKTFENPENVDLFEDGAFQSARALSDERRERIARIVARGLTSDERGRTEAKRILRLLSSVEDDHLIILASLGKKLALEKDFQMTSSMILERCT
ncbi:hypothetical protein [Methylobacterium nodulans]|uniref:Uncharacterized protein n=1 Tax=Methylobacterium nodulans (strain LMG 21967 / CNCM I-2342 / ORS 2060) TaxID=460265 RepID=B8IVV2_METNO|nr:hypothetical protein [Methylobacterium nodulans]ACL62542.1 hypothetical protein Mnod_8425 [Methylobacterium nodulans ORS 2060]